jgi:hypothetical protein
VHSVGVDRCHADRCEVWCERGILAGGGWNRAVLGAVAAASK